MRPPVGKNSPNLVTLICSQAGFKGCDTLQTFEHHQQFFAPLGYQNHLRTFSRPSHPTCQDIPPNKKPLLPSYEFFVYFNFPGANSTTLEFTATAPAL
jgi:hypothetical protein